MYHGLVERLNKEFQDLLHVSGRVEEGVRVGAQPDRKYATWIGGSIMASRVASERSWITKADYDEVGPGVVHRLFRSETATG